MYIQTHTRKRTLQRLLATMAVFSEELSLCRRKDGFFGTTFN